VNDQQTHTAVAEGIAVLLRTAIREYRSALPEAAQMPAVSSVDGPSTAVRPLRRRHGEIGDAVMDLLVQEKRPMSTRTIHGALTNAVKCRGISRGSVARAVDWLLRSARIKRAGADQTGALYVPA